ncbi:hypothetical protein V6N13_064436 [Hibiscus sabdariffa]|uniref:Uncharacterized protein n=1 Tax=Hibiscus sabdariffa TaxID=183260 RepID=A0ABR2EDL9_9ROSI
MMALRGVWQPKTLVVSCCDWGGSSMGISSEEGKEGCLCKGVCSFGALLVMQWISGIPPTCASTIEAISLTLRRRFKSGSNKT